jgi:hypothetical protein
VAGLHVVKAYELDLDHAQLPPAARAEMVMHVMMASIHLV